MNDSCKIQVEIEDAEKYRFDGECLLKAEEMGHPGIVQIEQKQVRKFENLNLCGE
jgi:hypothetical protein